MSNLERRADLCVSMLRRYVAAIGAQLDTPAHFLGGAVWIAQFQAFRESDPAAARFPNQPVRQAPAQGAARAASFAA